MLREQLKGTSAVLFFLMIKLLGRILADRSESRDFKGAALQGSSARGDQSGVIRAAMLVYGRHMGVPIRRCEVEVQEAQRARGVMLRLA